jgi:long-chain acyl-CoA synthetase
VDKIWLKEYPAGVPAEIDLSMYSSAVDVLEKSFSQYGDLDAFECAGATLGFAELDALTRNFASYLTNTLQLERGDRVAIMLPNLLQYPVAMFGILRAGMVVVNVNPLYTPRELEHQLRDSGACAIVILDRLSETFQSILGAVDLKAIITTKMTDMASLAEDANDATQALASGASGEAASRNVVDLRAALAAGSTQAFTPVPLTHDDNAFLQYTGGTTGLSKGAQLTHGNIVANLMQLKVWLGVATKTGEECFITMIPLYHIMGLTGSCLLSASLGSKNVLFPNPRDLDSSIAELKKHRFTLMLGVNTLFNSLLNAPAFADVDFSALKVTIGAGAAVQQVVAERWKKLTGNSMTEAYGLTETSPGATFSPLNKPDWNGTVGIPLPSTMVSLRDENNGEVPAGHAGELCIKGPQVMRGYWNRPDETAEVMTPDGYLKTGDIAIMDERGYFKLVDRKKDMILVSGFNVYPTEIEAVVAMHEGVLECACIGVPDEKSGEVPKVYIVKKDPGLASDDIHAHCKKHLTGYKLPKHYEFREQLPKSGVGKILRRELRNP